MKTRISIVFICLATLLLPATASEKEEADSTTRRISSAYPDLATGVLTHSILRQLPEDILVRADTVCISNTDLEKAIMSNPEPIREQLKKNAFFLLEQID